MKTLVPLSLFAAMAVFLVSPIRLEVGVSLLVVAGFMAIGLHDYSRRARLRLLSARTGATLSRWERFGLAA